MLTVEHLRKTDILQSSLISSYKNAVLNQSGLSFLNEMVLLGSFGQKDASNTSDMDVWLISDNKLSISELFELSQRELDVRKKIGSQFDYSNLDRHPATILSQYEADLYRKTFLTRVNLPYTLEEQLVIYGQRNGDHIPDSTDLCVSLEEFNDYWEKTGDPKWIRRIFTETEYFLYGKRLKSRGNIDIALSEKNLQPTDVLRQSSELIEKISRSTNPEDITKRKLSHKLMWTLEKVRWELFECMQNPSHIDQWRTGSEKKFGFYPREIGNLMLDVCSALGEIPHFSKELGLILIQLTRDTCEVTDLNYFHTILTDWLCSSTELLLRDERHDLYEDLTCMFPTTHEGKNTITKIAERQKKDRLKSEGIAWNFEQLEGSARIDNINNMALLEITDFGGNKITHNELASHIDSYAEIIRKLHMIPVRVFGRFGLLEQYTRYEDYLLKRVATSPLSKEMKEHLEKIIAMYSSTLNTSQPVFCHMDAGPRNLILTKNQELHIVDFEHASGCAKEWDIERILFQLTEELADQFEKIYYKNNDQSDKTIRDVTRLIMLATFNSHLSQNDIEWKIRCEEEIELLLERL